LTSLAACIEPAIEQWQAYANTHFWLFEKQGGEGTKASWIFDSIEFNDFWSRVFPPEQ